MNNEKNCGHCSKGRVIIGIQCDPDICIAHNHSQFVPFKEKEKKRKKKKKTIFLFLYEFFKKSDGSDGR